MSTRKRIIISRIDSIGDVVLTLPMCGVLKHSLPQYEIIFLGRAYTKAIVDCCQHVDSFWDWDQIKTSPMDDQLKCFSEVDVIVHVRPDREIASIAKRARIPLRIGTSHRSFHLFTCNKLIHFSRKKSDLHESQLNVKLLSPLGITRHYSTDELADFYGLTKVPALSEELLQLIDKEKFNLILHPKSRGSAREWGLSNFSQLINILPSEHFKIFITGTKAEGELVKDLFNSERAIINMTGKLSLEQLISFIDECNGLVAASTGPLHIAAALGKKVVGIFPPVRPMHPGRWRPIGKQASYVVKETLCDDCRKSENCHCIREITAEQVKAKLLHENSSL